jgi:hypothetical protein
MQSPQPQKINGAVLYNAEEIYNYDRVFFVGCSRPRMMIEKFNIPETEYCFYYQKNDEWVKASSTYRRAAMFLTENYVLKNIPKMKATVASENDNVSVENASEETDVKQMYKYEEVPEILELEDEEKFKDTSGNILEIEVRGERNSKNCYFRVKDVAKVFDMPNLDRSLRHINSDYEYETHYKCFIKRINIKEEKRNYTKIAKSLYLTYEGMLKVLYSSRSGNARLFTEWATHKLFTIHLGTREQKDELAAEIIGSGATPQAIREVFQTNASTVPCVYMFIIGSARQLLGDKYQDGDVLCKYGCANDFSERATQLEREYKKEFNVKTITSFQYCIVEPKFKFEAETSLKRFLKDYIIDYKTKKEENKKELVVINESHFNFIRQHFMLLQNSYVGRYKEMQDTIKELECKLSCEIQQRENDKEKYDLMFENQNLKHNVELNEVKHKHQMLEKDYIILQKDYELASMRK